VSYRKHHVKNKIKQIKPKKRFYKKPRFWIFSLFLIIFFGAAYFILFYSEFQIANISVAGNEKIKTQEIQNIANYNINKNISRSIFLIDEKKLEKNILSQFLAIEKVSAKKQFPKTMILNITERTPLGIFCSKNCSLFDENGVAFETVDKEIDGFSVLRGDKINKNIAQAFNKIKKNFQENFQINVKETILLNSLRLDVKTSEGWEAYFDLSSDINLQITKLNALLKGDLSQETRKNIQYIDLRFKDRAYYK